MRSVRTGPELGHGSRSLRPASLLLAIHQVPGHPSSCIAVGQAGTKEELP